MSESSSISLHSKQSKGMGNGSMSSLFSPPSGLPVTEGRGYGERDWEREGNVSSSPSFVSYLREME